MTSFATLAKLPPASRKPPPRPPAAAIVPFNAMQSAREGHRDKDRVVEIRAP